MGDRGSFVTEYIYCRDCYAAVGRVLDEAYKGASVMPVSIADGIWAGFEKMLYSGGEVVFFEYDLRKAIESAICHGLQIAVMCEYAPSRKILTYWPEEWNRRPIIECKECKMEQPQFENETMCLYCAREL